MSKYPLKIFLPAAGLGERLRPVTNHLPKPLLPVLGRPLIQIILEKLTAVCTGKIGINLHYKPEMIRGWVRNSPYADRAAFFPEDPILGTGGALKNAEAFLASGPFIVHNSDILLDIDFSRLIEEHLASRNAATLVCHRLPHLSNVVIDGNGQVLDVDNAGASIVRDQGQQRVGQARQVPVCDVGLVSEGERPRWSMELNTASGS